MSSLSGQVGASSSQPGYDVTRCGARHPLKPAKKYRSETENQIVRCKRKLDFIADGADGGGGGDGLEETPGRRGRGGVRRQASVARRNERERKRVSLINRTFETLRDQLPVSLWGHRNLAKVSKVETLRAAIGYIRTLEELLAADSPDGDDAIGANDDEQLLEMLSSAERLASLAGTNTAQVAESLQPQFCHIQFSSSALHAANAACERLEYLSSGDIDGATRRLAILHEPAASQQTFYTPDDLRDLVSRGVTRSDGGHALPLLDINSNYDNLEPVKPRDDDVILHLVADNFTFDATIGS